MDSKTFQSNDINPPYGADVIFWGIDITKNDMKKDEGDKVRYFDVHCIHPWILSIDRDDVIYVWDFCKNQCLFHESFSQLLHLSSNSLELDKIDMKESVVNKKRYDYISTSNHPLYKYSASIFDDLILGSTIKKSLFSSEISSSNTSANSLQRVTNSKDYGNVKMIKFIDESCLINDTLNNELYQPRTFHSSAHMMILCDTCVVYHKFLSSMTHSSLPSSASTKVITSAELNNKIPTSAEFIYNSICAIGCSDGIIRIWDCLAWREIKQLSAHAKGSDILAIKSLPILRRNDDRTDSSSALYDRVTSIVTTGKGGSVTREGRIRVLSIGSDSNAYIWDAGVTGNIIELDGKIPIARLDQIGSSSVAVCHNVYLDESNNKLHTLSADNVVRIWDLDQLPDFVTSSTQSMKNDSSHGHSSSLSGNMLTRPKSGRRLSSFGTQSFASNDFDSIFTSSSSSPRYIGKSAAGGTKLLQCIIKFKVSSTTFPQPTLSKLTSFVQFQHPRYYEDTYLIAAKTNHFAIVASGYRNTSQQSLSNVTTVKENRCNTVSSQVSSNSSTSQYTMTIKNSSDKAIKVQCMHILNLNAIMASYFQNLKSPLSVNMMSAAADPSLKIYKLQPHAVYTNLVTLATSIGVIVINVCPIKPGPYLGKHPLWGKNCILEITDNRLLLKSISVSDSLVTPENPNDGVPVSNISNPSAPVEIDSSVSVDHEELLIDIDDTFNSGGFNSGNATSLSSNTHQQLIQLSQSTTNIYSNAVLHIPLTPSSSVKLASIDASPSKLNKYLSTGSRSRSNTSNTSSSVSSNSSSTPNLHLLSATDPSFDAKLSHSKPVYIPSLCGHYCALIWQESNIYIIVRMIHNSDKSTQGNSMHNGKQFQYLIEGMEVVKKGYCLSFAWFDIIESVVPPAAAVDVTTTSIQYECNYAILEKGKREISVLKPKSMLNLSAFRSSGSGSMTETTEGDLIPPHISFHCISSPLTSNTEYKSSNIDAYSSNTVPLNITLSHLSDLHQPYALYSGGPLICITSLRPSCIKQKSSALNTNINNNLTTTSVSSSSSTAAYSDMNNLKSNTTGHFSPETLKSSSDHKLKTNVINAIFSLQQQASKSLEEIVGNEDYQSIEYLKVSRFYKIVKQVKSISPHNVKAKDKKDGPAVVSHSSTLGEHELLLEPVGVFMPAVTSVEWTCDSSTPVVAVLIHTRINILQLQIINDITPDDETMTAAIGKKSNHSKKTQHVESNSDSIKMKLVSVASIELASNIFMTPTSLCWQSNILYVTTPFLVYMISTAFPCNSKNRNHTRDEESWFTTLSEAVDVVVLTAKDYSFYGICPGRYYCCTDTSNSMTQQSSDDSSLFLLKCNHHPICYFPHILSSRSEIVSCPHPYSNDCGLVMTSKENHRYSYVPLTSNPVAIVLYLLSQSKSLPNTNLANPSLCPYVIKAFEWACRLPDMLHDDLAKIFIKRKLFLEALRLPKLSNLMTRDIKRRFSMLYTIKLSSDQTQIEDQNVTPNIKNYVGGQSMTLIDENLSKTSMGSIRFNDYMLSSQIFSFH